MSIFIRDFKLDKQRLSVLLFGSPKTGKTRAILRAVEAGHFAVLISTDHGTLEIYRNPTKYKGRLVVAEVYNLSDMRTALEEGKQTVRSLIRKGVPASNIWACIDTITHLQIMLLTEARRISLKNPDSKDSRDEFVRDITTQADWGINLGLMSECANMLNSYPCNVVNIALERESRTTHKPEPGISGQSGNRFTGDADLLLRMVVEKGQEKFLTSVSDGAGDRSGVLDAVEEPDLIAIRKKIFGNAEKGQEPENGSETTEAD